MYPYDERRSKWLQNVPPKTNSWIIGYWMCRDYRVSYNWSLIRALNLAHQLKKKMKIYLFLGHLTNIHQIQFLKETCEALEKEFDFYRLSYVISYQDPSHYLKQEPLGYLIVDMDPLLFSAFPQLPCTVEVVDSHNVIPVWITSPKQEYSARTIRLKINKQLSDFLKPFPKLKPCSTKSFPNKIEDSPFPKSHHNSPFHGGTQEGLKQWQDFVQHRLVLYEQNKRYITSRLSPWIHFGCLSTQALLLTIKDQKLYCPKLIEQLLVRKELADNFCFYTSPLNPVLPFWIKQNIKDHRLNPRKDLYTLEQMEKSQTRNHLWNTLQTQLVRDGIMNSYARMYWGKQIAFWTPTIEEAIRTAYYLNDKYAIDGISPNGYVNILWCLVGLHDRPFRDQPILGKVRTMGEKKVEMILQKII